MFLGIFNIHLCALQLAFFFINRLFLFCLRGASAIKIRTRRLGREVKMIEAVSLELYLERWAKGGVDRTALVETILGLAVGCQAICGRIRKGALPGGFGGSSSVVALGQANLQTDYEAHREIEAALKKTPAAAMASRLHDAPVALSGSGKYAVCVSPLDGSATIDSNAAVGTVFSVLSMPDGFSNGAGALEAAFLQCGRKQRAAGFAVYGPRTNLVLTLGDGTHVFTLDADSGCFILTAENVKMPPSVREYAINAANYRHWDEAIRTYVDDCLKGSEGLRALDFNMRWIGSPVAEIFRIIKRGGIYLYPADMRAGYTSGRFWQLFEANPIAFVVEQAGGAASTGRSRILEVSLEDLHQRIPMIVGSSAEVDYLERLHADPFAHGERSPLFGRRGLFRS